MSKSINIVLALAGAVALTSCGKMGALSADNFTVTPNPMETNGGKVDVTINGKFPQKYMIAQSRGNRYPVMKYAGNQTPGQSARFKAKRLKATIRQYLTRLAVTIP